MQRTMRYGVVVGLMAAGLNANAQVATNAPDPKVAEFQQLVESVQRDPSSASGETMVKLLTLGGEAGRPQAAAAVAKSYLAQRRDVAPGLLLQAASIAESAGDLHSAAARYKQYLKLVPPGTDVSATTLHLYSLLAVNMGAADDAYRLMTEMGDAARASVALKRFDGWYLDQARRRHDITALATRLAAVMGDAMPLEMERTAYWDYLDSLMREIAGARPEHFGALPACRKIAGLIRENDAWSKRFAFQTAYLAYTATAAGKDAATLDRDFEPVAAAARAYVDAAPNADVLKEIFRTFGGGWDRINDPMFQRVYPQMAQFGAYAFGKLSDKDRDVYLSPGPGWDPYYWASRLMTRELYGQVLTTYPDYFRKTPNIDRLSLVTDSTNAAVYKALAPMAQGLANSDALIVTALGTSDDLYGCWQRVFQGGWFVAGGGDIAGIMNTVWVRFSRLARPGVPAIAGNANELAMVRFGTDVLAKTPAFLFDSALARSFVTSAWRYGSPDGTDKTKAIAAWHLLDWIPYDAATRKAVFDDANREFRAWADQARNQQRDQKSKVDAATKPLDAYRKQREEEAKKPNANLQPTDAKIAEQTKALDAVKADLAKADALAAMITPVEEAFKLVMDPKVTDLTKAPDEQCRNLAKAVVALQTKNLAAYLEAARAAYPAVKSYPAQKAPFARVTLRFLLGNRLDTFDTLDFQCEVLADQLAQGSPEAGNAVAGEVYTLINENRLWQNQPEQKPKRMKLNATLAKALRDMLAKNQFSGTAFAWFRETRQGPNWHEVDGDADIMEALLTRKDLPGNWLGQPVTLMSLIRYEFPKLADKYPATTWFDNLVAAAAKQSRFLDRSYYEYGGTDSSGIVVRAAAEVYQDYERLPFGYAGTNTPVYTDRERFWDMQGRAMGAPAPVRDAMLTRLESFFGKTRFDHYANGGARLSTYSVNGPADRKKYFDALTAWVAARDQEPVKPYQPSFSPVGQLRGSDLTDEELNVIVRVVQLCPDLNWAEWGDLDHLVCEGLVAHKRGSELFPLAPQLWGMARVQPNGDAVKARLVAFANSSADAGRSDLAASFASAGLEIMGSLLKDDERNALMALKTKALSGVLAVVSVDRADRRFPMFQAQADYQMGKFEEAWQTYLGSKSLFGEAYRELDPTFSIWLISKLTDVGNYTDAEGIARLMIQWVDQTPQSFEAEDRARLLLAYAQISFARQEFPRARAICEQVATAKEFEDTRARSDADLKIADIDRLTKHFDKAIERMDNMLRKRDAYVQSEANYELALVKFDQEEYPESRAFVDKVLAVAPAHPNARILEGKLYLKMKKLVEATNVRAGTAASQKTIMPGKPLKVSLEDRNLGLVGLAANIEIKAWTDSGDEESFTLLPFGDSKTKFEGQIPTALGAARKGDGTLQLLGGDMVHYDFSDLFKRSNKIAGQEPVSIRVVSDGELYVSSGKILSKEEQEQRQLENLIRARMQAESKIENAVALSTVRADDEIKPGNRINVRVVDPDECVSSNRDVVYVKASTSSGDQVGRVPLTETEPYSGVFEGFVQTASALATAFASSSEDGKEPNFAITSAEYPPWVGLPDNQRPKWFSVDLNNNCTLGTMKLVADVPGRKLKKFILQSSPNGEDFVSLGAWPANLSGWLGAGQIEVVRYGTATKPPATLRDFKDYLDVGYTVDGCEKITSSPPPLEVRWDKTVNGLGDRLQLAWDGPNSVYLGHIQCSFYQPATQKRSFRLGTPDARRQIRNLYLTLDSEPGAFAGEVSKTLRKGMHRLDVYFAATRQGGVNFWLETDTGSSARSQRVKCTPEMFAAPANVSTNDLSTAARDIAFQPAAITNSADNSSFTVLFPSNTMARMVRLWMLDFETDAPAIRKVYLTDSDGKALLPTAQDVVKLRYNDQLEIVPGDRITISYEDPHYLNKERRFSEAFMRATFHNGTINACFIESEVDESGTRHPRYIPMRRFKPGDTINVFVNDPDCDTTDERDVVKLQAKSGLDGATITIDALETEAHSGIFLGKVFPVSGTPQRPSEIKLGPNDDLRLTYRDVENTDPGIPWDRTVTLEQTDTLTPELRVYNYATRPLSTQEVADVRKVMEGAKKTDEVVPVTRSITAIRPDAATNALAKVLMGCPLVVELTHPAMAQSPLSSAAIFVQTSAGRKLYGKPLEAGFDLNVPGTVRVESPPSDHLTILPPPGYRDVSVVGVASDANALDDGRFTFMVPLKLGPVPPQSLADVKPEVKTSGSKGESESADSDWTEVSLGVTTVDARGLPQNTTRTIMVPALHVRGNDEVFIGYRYTDAAGSNQWITSSASLTADPFFDVMDRRYQESVTNIHVGETVYLRVINPMLDRTDEKDSATVQIKTDAGQTQPLTLTETFGHSGVFKGLSQLVFAGDPAASNAVGAVRVGYGDTLAMTYTPTDSTQGLVRAVEVYKGDDGAVVPFTKRFKEPAIAVQTQLTVAEAYFEMAKKHRELAQEDLARREIGQGKKLLEEAIRDYPNTDARAQADYLLADLALESAAQVEDPEQKTKFYLEAVGRFTDIVASYPDSPYAPKAQFKKALTYEKMGKIDEACEEYVKLSYRYPDNELVAETIARLGQYFLTKGKTYQERIASETNIVARERVRLESLDMYKTAAQVFGRLSERFPDHKLAGKTTVLSGQCYMRAEDFERSISVFKKVIDAKKADPDLLAEAMYWCGDSYMKDKKGNSLDGMVNAYRMFKKLTWDYPETIWAKYARGRLTEEAMAKMEAEGQN